MRARFRVLLSPVLPFSHLPGSPYKFAHGPTFLLPALFPQPSQGLCSPTRNTSPTVGRVASRIPFSSLIVYYSGGRADPFIPAIACQLDSLFTIQHPDSTPFLVQSSRIYAGNVDEPTICGPKSDWFVIHDCLQTLTPLNIVCGSRKYLSVVFTWHRWCVYVQRDTPFLVDVPSEQVLSLILRVHSDCRLFRPSPTTLSR